MFLPLLLALQVAGPKAGTLPATTAGLPDKLQVGRKCPTGTPGDEFVVCGRVGQEQFRLHPLPPQPVKAGLPRAEAKVGDASVDVRAEDVGVGGFTSHRVMAGIKLPF